jgi:hypothetical protein
MRNKLVFAGTIVGFMVLWWWAYVKPMDDLRAEMLDCMDRDGEIEIVCRNDR